MIQGSEEWKQAKCGKISASRIGDLMATTKSGQSASRKNYIAELVCERLTGLFTEHFTSAAMNHGTETEPIARAEYEARNGVLVHEVGFLDHPKIPMAGASPDGLIGDDGGIEIKCPNTATHIETLLTGKIDIKYIYQIMWNLEVTGRKWWDFISFDNRLPVEYSYFCKRVFVEEFTENIKSIKEEVIKANQEIDDIIRKLKEMKK